MLAACAPAAPSPTAPSKAAEPAKAAEAAKAPLSKAEGPAEPAKGAAAKTAFDEKAVGDFYRGKNIRFVVGFDPGGVFDLYSRLLAKHMPQFVPGNPNMIVENKPGAGSMVAANAVYNTEPKDGTVIGSVNEFLVIQQLMGAPGIQYDMAKAHWIGSSVNTATACLARKDSGVNSIQDVIDGKELVIGTTGLGAATHDPALALNAALGTRFKLVSGYGGIAKIHLALEGTEVSGYCVSLDAISLLGKTILEGENPTARIIVVMGSETPDHPWLKGVPAAETLAKTDEARQMLKTVHGPSRMSKPFVVAPDVPRDRVEALRAAMTAAFNSPQFREDAQKANQDLSPSDGQLVTRIVQEVLNTPPPIVAKLKDVLK
jgi:tripartite-type tricarboxylate transporter receptor subunit TctC